MQTAPHKPEPAPWRIGAPRPLVFHLGAALATYQQALLPADAAAPLPPPPDCAAPPLAIAREAARRLATLEEGIARWQHHPYRRRLPDPPALWREGATRLLDYGGTGPVILVVPSLVNRAYILDLRPGHALLRWLAGQGLQPLLLDWGEPGGAEHGADLDTYGQRLAQAVTVAVERAGGPVGLVGYCMGGTLAAAYAATRPERLSSLALLGAPWRFSRETAPVALVRALGRALGTHDLPMLLDRLTQVFGAVPVELLQLFFAWLDPILAARKFRRFAALDPASDAAEHFVAIEDWLADGVPMAGPAAREVLGPWYLEDAPAKGAWSFLGQPVRAEAIRLPTLAVCAAADRIAPPACTEALPEAIPGAQTLRPTSGHVGMIVGRAAPDRVWRPLAEFLQSAAA
ncbi:MAG: alpha/beta fold hydrolase [Pseudomonadota bacterium]